jgi:two-component system, NarL family, sensor histidine kinase UhpB
MTTPSPPAGIVAVRREPKRRHGHITILLVEDRRSDAILVTAMLTGDPWTEFHCQWVGSLAKARDVIAETDFDCVLLDMNLPDSVGPDTLAGIHDISTKPAVIVLTGFDDEDLAGTTVAAGAQDFLTKGKLDRRLLANAIRHAVERKRIHDELVERADEAQRALTELRATIGLLEGPVSLAMDSDQV